MSQAVASPQAPVQESSPAQKPQVEVPQDLNQRLSTPSPKQEAQHVQSDASIPQVSISLDDIKDPVQKGIVQKHLEAKLKEANDKIARTFGEIGGEKAKLLKQVDELGKQLESVKNKTFTPTDIQQLINRPDFIQAVQSYQQQAAPEGWNRPQEEWSALSEHDKQMVQQAMSEARAARNQLNAMQMSTLHTELKTVYPDYDPSEVEDVITKANTGHMTQREIFELTYKARKFDDKIKEAYRLGWEDRNKNIGERVNGATLPSGVQTNISDDPLVRNQGETTRSFFKRIAERNFQRLLK